MPEAIFRPQTPTPLPFAYSPPAEKELADFSYIVSHDLAASLRYVTEFAKLLVQDLGENASDTQRSYANYIQSSSDRCRLQMDGLLAYSRVQQRALSPARCDMTRLMEVAVLQLSAQVRAVDAQISIEPLGEQVVDADLMTMAFKHVLDNCLKFRRPDVAPLIEVRGLETADAWIVQIADNGIGAPLERQEKLFGMFYQDHAENTYPGAGAGLAICRRILRRHGGDVSFISTNGGSCLEISLPALDEESGA